MTEAELISIIKNSNYTRYFKVKLNTSEIKKVRLFLDRYDTPCIFRSGSSRYGFPVATLANNWVEVIPIQSDEDYVIVRKFMEKVVRYLTYSGLWQDMKNAYQKILEQGDDYIKHLITLGYTEQREYLKQTIGDVSLYVDSIITTAKKGIVSINYHAHEKYVVRDKAKQAIRTGLPFVYNWRKNYDNTIEFKTFEDGTKCGWYATEYKNCGNGHYYYALDERHAIFGETD